MEAGSTELTRLLHDGRLEAVRVDGDRVHLECRTSDGATVIITLGGIVDVSCNNFRNGNSILDVTVSESSDCINRNDWAALCQSEDPGRIADYKHRLASMAVQYFLLTSSHGGEVVAVCAKGSISVADGSSGAA